METEAKYTVVGLAVVITTLVAVVAMFWLTKAGGGTAYTRYTVYFEKQSLAGLQDNSYVTMKGISVGSVEKLIIAPHNIEKVKVTLKVEKKTPVKMNSQAVIVRNLLTGFASIDLQNGTQQSALLENVPEGETYPVIQEGTSKLDQVADNIPEFLNHVSDTIGRLEQFVSDENVKHVNQTLANADRFTTALAQSDGEITALLKNLNETSRDVRDVTKSIRQLVDKSGDAIVGSTGEIQKLLVQVQVLTVELQKNLKDLTEQMSGSSQVATQSIEQMARGISQASQSLVLTADSLRDLKGAVFGPQKGSMAPGEE